MLKLAVKYSVKLYSRFKHEKKKITTLGVDFKGKFTHMVASSF